MISVFAGIFNNFYRMAAFSIAFNIGAAISGFAPLVAEYISKFSKFAVLEFLSIALLILMGTLVNFSRLKHPASILTHDR